MSESRRCKSTMTSLYFLHSAGSDFACIIWAAISWHVSWVYSGFPMFMGLSAKHTTTSSRCQREGPKRAAHALNISIIDLPNMSSYIVRNKVEKGGKLDWIERARLVQLHDPTIKQYLFETSSHLASATYHHHIVFVLNRPTTGQVECVGVHHLLAVDRRRRRHVVDVSGISMDALLRKILCCATKEERSRASAKAEHQSKAAQVQREARNRSLTARYHKFVLRFEVRRSFKKRKANPKN